jgi:hypothetical protein
LRTENNAAHYCQEWIELTKSDAISQIDVLILDFDLELISLEII